LYATRLRRYVVDMPERNGARASARGDGPHANTKMLFRRARGLLLRFVRRRALASVVGIALAVPGAWIEFSGRVSAWWIEGLALISGATGLALLWTGVSGTKPDWIE